MEIAFNNNLSKARKEIKILTLGGRERSLMSKELVPLDVVCPKETHVYKPHRQQGVK